MITGLLQIPPTVTANGVIVQATRLGHALFPPEAPKKSNSKRRGRR